MRSNGELLNLPAVGIENNNIFGAAQLNIATAQLPTSSTTLADSMGEAGEKHIDEGDNPAYFTHMVCLSDLPPSFNPGLFCLMYAGVFVMAEPFTSVCFQANREHSGTPLIASADVSDEEMQRAARVTLVAYPPTGMTTRVHKAPLCALGNRESFYAPPESIAPELAPRRWHAGHSTVTEDGPSLMPRSAIRTSLCRAFLNIAVQHDILTEHYEAWRTYYEHYASHIPFAVVKGKVDLSKIDNINYTGYEKHGRPTQPPKPPKKARKKKSKSKNIVCIHFELAKSSSAGSSKAAAASATTSPPDDTPSTSGGPVTRQSAALGRGEAVGINTTEQSASNVTSANNTYRVLRNAPGGSSSLSVTSSASASLAIDHSSGTVGASVLAPIPAGSAVPVPVSASTSGNAQSIKRPSTALAALPGTKRRKVSLTSAEVDFDFESEGEDMTHVEWDGDGYLKLVSSFEPRSGQREGTSLAVSHRATRSRTKKSRRDLDKLDTIGCSSDRPWVIDEDIDSDQGGDVIEGHEFHAGLAASGYGTEAHPYTSMLNSYYEAIVSKPLANTSIPIIRSGWLGLVRQILGGYDGSATWLSSLVHSMDKGMKARDPQAIFLASAFDIDLPSEDCVTDDRLLWKAYFIHLSTRDHDALMLNAMWDIYMHVSGSTFRGTGPITFDACAALPPSDHPLFDNRSSMRKNMGRIASLASGHGLPIDTEPLQVREIHQDHLELFKQFFTDCYKVIVMNEKINNVKLYQKLVADPDYYLPFRELSPSRTHLPRPLDHFLEIWPGLDSADPSNLTEQISCLPFCGDKASRQKKYGGGRNWLYKLPPERHTTPQRNAQLSSSDDDERHARDADIINLNKADDRTIETYENETGPGPTPPYAPDWANIKGPWNYALFKLFIEKYATNYVVRDEEQQEDAEKMFMDRLGRLKKYVKQATRTSGETQVQMSKHLFMKHRRVLTNQRRNSRRNEVCNSKPRNRPECYVLEGRWSVYLGTFGRCNGDFGSRWDERGRKRGRRRTVTERLPINFYDEEWYKRFNEREKKALMIRAKAPFDLLEFHSMGQ
ncbi:hypothetical protein BDZ97DRAFT_1760053 [Flammula alnicola]|nr:hypothetical protein BDZ97DRAFT_1760053 [Flammula alnicola]